jgi:hypothetical protein
MLIQTASLRFFCEPENKVYARILTPTGAACIDLDRAMWQGKEYVGVYVPKQEVTTKKISAKKQKRASIEQETKVMAALGGRRQPGSGAIAGFKGDGRVKGEYRVEMKMTRRDSFRVTRKDLGKIRGECDGLEKPLFVMDFVDPETGGSADRWVMMPFEEFQKLREKANATNKPR